MSWAMALMGRLHFRQKRGRCVEACLKDEDRKNKRARSLIRVPPFNYRGMLNLAFSSGVS